jgi:coenzyme F420-0:L-glutamate ligase/coenzyme F420-1:gamma-L-glutamate ligase
MGDIRIIPLMGFPKVKQGDDLAEMILHVVSSNGKSIQNKDVVVVTQKVVSKAEGRLVALDSVRVGAWAWKLAKKLGKDPRLVELILQESRRIVRAAQGVLITETKQGFVCANSGIDQSNVEPGYVTLLPSDPDRSARKLRRKLEKLTRKRIAVLVTDTFGRPWRLGQTDVVIGCSGIRPLEGYRGEKDPFGYELRVTEPAIADELAAASELAMRKLSMIPACIVRGFAFEPGEERATTLVRPREKDLFR